MCDEDLIRALRAERPGLPVVVVTGSAPFGGAEALRRNADGHGLLTLLLKPPDYAELAAALRRAVAPGADSEPATEVLPSMELANRRQTAPRRISPTPIEPAPR